jgi:periplasmic protein TonB
MTGDHKRIGAAIAASAFINLSFLLSIVSVPEASPISLNTLHQTPPMRVGLLPSRINTDQIPQDLSGSRPADSSIKEESAQKTVSVKAHENQAQDKPEPETKERSVSENSPADFGRVAEKTRKSRNAPVESKALVGPDDPDESDLGVSQSSSRDSRSEFLIFLQREITARQEYPFRARRTGTEGTVVLALQVLADGSLMSCEVADSSGSASLDRAAAKLVRGIFPAARMPGEDISCTITVEYRLN